MQLNELPLLRMFLVGTCCVLWPAKAVYCQEAETAEQAQQQEEADSQAPTAKFNLLELRVKGNSVIDKKLIERSVYRFLGPGKTIDVVEEARAALEKLYQNQGYQTVSVDIPEQDVKNGVVYLQVVEGTIAKLRVKDSRYFDQGAIKARVPELAEGKVPNLPKMQAQLAQLAADSQDRTVAPILRAGETPGTLEVDLKVKDELPLHGKVEVNARNTANTSRLRTIISMHYDNLWQKFHSASFMYQTAPENNEEVEVLVGSYVLPVIDDSKRLALYAVSSSSTSQIASAGALSIIGTGDIYGARLVMPMSGSKTYNHTATLGVDYKDFKEDLALLGADSLKTPISYLPFMAQYSGNLRDSESLLSFDMGINFGIRGLGNDEQQFADKRFLSRPNYIYLNGGLNYRRNLPWGMEMAGRVAGQISDSPLISNEQFSMGGMKSVRGYLETHVLADDGVSASLELYSPRLAPDDWESVDSLKALMFADGGKGWLMDALPGSAQEFALASVGAGLRVGFTKHLLGEFDFAVPLLDQGTVRAGENRVDFRLITQF
ncbi:MAG: ShlB/FhaC/HecB family hemolysin secretion/activation protein [Methylomonas sp.]|nr:ShlB/FhaC/HecB family hemolysin secretion/activation protein [Methylomonas sp.]